METTPNAVHADAAPALVRATRRLQRAMAAACEGLFEYALDCDEAYYSSRAYELLGYQPGELPQTRALLRDRVHPDDRERCQAAMRTGITHRVRWELEYRLACKSGEYRWFRERSNVSVDADGTPLVTGMISDIDDEHRARDEAEQASRAKSQFLANTSHEMRTPLHGVLGMLDLLRCGRLGDQERQWADTAWRSARGLIAIINDILDLSKVEAGKLRLESISFQPREVVREACDLLDAQATNKGLELRCHIAANVPLSLRGDPVRVGQILANLVGNAVKFTECGHIRVSVDACANPAAGRCELIVEVSDSGIGMTQQTITELFMPFMQADNSMARRFGGTGLGLAICKQLVDLMQGKIGVESAPGRGSRFEVRLPLEVDPVGPARVLAHAEVARLPGVLPTRHAVGPTRVLVVEDNAVNQLVAESALRKLGVEDVVLAEDGLRALAFCRKHRFDLVLMDCQMPELDGFATLAALRDGVYRGERLSTETTVPVIAMTANAHSGEVDRCLTAGFDDYLGKPFDLSQMRDVVNRHLRVAQHIPSMRPRCTAY